MVVRHSSHVMEPSFGWSSGCLAREVLDATWSEGFGAGVVTGVGVAMAGAVTEGRGVTGASTFEELEVDGMEAEEAGSGGVALAGAGKLGTDVGGRGTEAGGAFVVVFGVGTVGRGRTRAGRAASPGVETAGVGTA